MEDSLICEDSNDREEGEIVDDDLEDISDNSIIDPMLYSGKSVSEKEHLYALSLSSVSDFDDELGEEYSRNFERREKRRRRLKRSKRRRIYYSEDSSDSESNHLHRYLKRSRSKSSPNSENSRSTRKLKKQLHKAVHVDVEDIQQSNSLKERLQAMSSSKNNNLDGNDYLPDENDKKAIVISDNEANEEDIDNELFSLRAEALKTALINKFARKKRRKSNAAVEEVNTDLQDVDKENENVANDENKDRNVEKTETDCTKEKSTNIEDNTPDEDEDVLRALLLASISKKMTKGNTQTTTAVNTTTNNRFLNNKPLINNTNKIISTKVPQLMQVKPLIINLGPSDSDSDCDHLFESQEKPESEQQSVDVASISSSVDKFLREQRAKVEAVSSANPSSSSALLTPKKSNLDNSLIIKSAVKLLPKNKQLEYQKLMQRLKLAEKRKQLKLIKLASQEKTKNVDKKIVSNTNVSNQNVKAGQTTINPKNSSQARETANKCTSNNPNKTNNGLTTNNTISITKTHETATKASQNAINVTPLGNTAGKNSSTGNNNTTGSTEMLQKILKEVRIQKDGRLQIQENYKELNPLLKRISKASSDRKKHKQNVDRLLKELEDEKKLFSQSHSEYVSCVKEFIGLKKEIDAKIKLSKANKIQQTEAKQADKVSEIETQDISIGDPNDIHLIIKRQPAKTVAAQPDANFSQYISPLVHNKSMDDDPLAIICPFEITGTCKDTECTYKHLSK